MSARKRKGDAAEAAYADILREFGRTLGWPCVVFPLSPSHPGVDLIRIDGKGILLVEVKGQRRKLGGKALAKAVRELKTAWESIPARHLRDHFRHATLHAILVHRQGPGAPFRTLWACCEEAER